MERAHELLLLVLDHCGEVAKTGTLVRRVVAPQMLVDHPVQSC
jgi:hypothetical protein